jgi:hypothetical protein
MHYFTEHLESALNCLKSNGCFDSGATADDIMLQFLDTEAVTFGM